MAYNGSGTFLINTAGQPVVAGTVISSTTFNALTADLATGLSTVITKDGQTTVTANIPMASFKFTGLGVGSAATDSATLSQVQSTVTKLLASVSGADTVTATASPTLAAYAAGQMFYFVAAGDNTTSVTLNIDALGAKAVTRDGSVALAAADIKSGEVVVVVYDGTRFQVVSQLNSAGDARFANVSIASSLYVGGVSTFVGNAGFSANVSITSALSVGGVAAITGATTIGGNLTLSGGTANGVLYLNASKVATSGSALTFDGTNFASTGSLTGSTLKTTRASGAQPEIVLTQTSVASWSIYNPPASTDLRFYNGSDLLTLASSGNLGLGVTPSAWTTFSSALEVPGGALAGISANQLDVWQNCFYNSSSFKYISTAGATLYQQAGSSHTWFNAPSGTAGNTISFTQAMTLDAAGNLLVGTTSASNIGGRGSRVNCVQSTNGAWAGGFIHSTATGAQAFGFAINYSGSSPNSTLNPMLYCEDSTALRAEIRSNGGLANYSANNVNLSDERTKKDIAPLGSMWDKFKAIEIVTFKYKDQTHNDDNIGVIAQQVESVAPEFVDIDGFGETPEDGVPFKTVYTTDMYHAAIKALQEAMARIETLEAKVTALESK